MTFRNIAPGDVVTYRTPQGQTRQGRAQRLLCFASHVVCDRGNGQPVVVNADNYVSHKSRKVRAVHDRPLAVAGLTSYRARGRYGWIMIGARDDADAMQEAQRSTDAPTDLQRWDGTQYVAIS